MPRLPEGLRRLASTARASQFGRNVAMLAGGTALAHLIALASVPVLTRLYTPADMGILGVFSSFVAIAAALVCLRFDVAVVAAATRNEAAALTAAAIVVAVPATLLSAVGLAAMIRLKILGFETLPPLAIGLAAATVFLTAVFTTLRYWFIRGEEFPLIARISIYQGIARAVGQIGFGVFAFGWIGLAGGELLSRAAGIGRMTLSAARQIRETHSVTRGAMRAAVRRYASFALYSFPATLIDMIALQLPLPLLARYYGAGAAGEFMLVQRVLTVPLAFVAASVADTFHGRAAAYAREHPENLRALFLKTARALFLTGVVPVAAIMIVAPAVFPWLFGAGWERAGVLAAIVGPLALVQMIVSPISRIVFVVEKILPLKLISDFSFLAVVIAAFTLGKMLGLSLYGAVGCYVVGFILVYVLYFFLMLNGLPKGTEVPQ